MVGVHKSETQKSACFLLLTTPSSSSKNVQRSETKGAYFLILTTISSKERSQDIREVRCWIQRSSVLLTTWWKVIVMIMSQVCFPSADDTWIYDTRVLCMVDVDM
ncbi:hypothetical protein K1719_032024 [Acacia pycnantha]|nr:hypothetical protein K1719_032024 [Acacia pycnantha]